MAELLIKVGHQGVLGDHRTYEDGDIIAALPDCLIGFERAHALCCPEAGRDRALVEGYLRRVVRYRVERLSSTEYRKWEQWSPGKYTDHVNPNFPQKIAMMKASRGDLYLFGSRGREVFYVGARRHDPATIDALWTWIEGVSPLRRADHSRVPWGGGDLATCLAVRVPDMAENFAATLTRPEHEPDPDPDAGPDDVVVLRKRTRRYDWEDIAGISGKTRADIRKPGTRVDVRAVENTLDHVAVKTAQIGLR